MKIIVFKINVLPPSSIIRDSRSHFNQKKIQKKNESQR